MTPLKKDAKEPFLEKWRTAPRVTSLKSKFEDLATGRVGYPGHQCVTAQTELFGGRTDILRFHRRYLEYSGTFNAHFLASIPFVLEEECRLGAAMTKYLQRLSRSKGRKATLQTIGNAEAVIARTIVSQSQGRVLSLSNSPSRPNEVEFLKNRPEGSHFFHGPFFDVDRVQISKERKVPEFLRPFDIVYEDTTFQMYGPDRENQIPFILENLAADGILVCLEKCTHPSATEYFRREAQKDRDFKSLYFLECQVEQKLEILSEMEQGQVSLAHLKETIAASLKHVAVTWNSGNFYMVAASRNREALSHFLKLLGPPCIPPAFYNEMEVSLFLSN